MLQTMADSIPPIFLHVFVLRLISFLWTRRVLTTLKNKSYFLASIVSWRI